MRSDAPFLYEKIAINRNSTSLLMHTILFRIIHLSGFLLALQLRLIS
jgi:hypothetical protein